MGSRAWSRSGRTDQYLPGDRGAWVKSKCLNRAEFVVVGWSDPEGSRHLIGSLLLSYYNSEGRLIYGGRVGTGMSVKTLAMLHERLAPLATSTMPLSSPLPRRSRFGGTLALSKVHWVRPELVAEINIADDCREMLRACQESTALMCGVDGAIV
jgi:ATP-dependent DNA ligase